MSNCTVEAKKNAVAIAKGTTSIESVEQAQKSATSSTVGLTIAQTALNAVVGLGIGVAVSFITKGISKLINYQDDLIDKMNESISKFEEQRTSLSSNKSTIDEISSDYARLAQGVDNLGRNVSLNSEEYLKYNEIVNKIAEMFPQMVQGYTDEGNAIIANKGNVEALTQAYKDQKQAYLDNIITQSADTFAGYKAQVTETPWTERAKGKQGTYALAEQKKYIDELIKSLDKGENAFDEFYSNAIANSDIYDVLYSATKEACFDWGGVLSINDRYLKASESTNKEKLYSYANNLQTQIDTATSKIKPIMQAYMERSYQYQGLDSDVQDVVQQIVSQFDSEFYQQFDNESNMANWITENIVSKFEGVDGAKIAETFSNAFELKTQFQNGDVSLEDYLAGVQDFKNLIDGFDDNTKKSVELIFSVNSESGLNVDTLINNVKGKLQDSFDDKVGTLSLEDLDIASKLEMDPSVPISWDELIAKIEGYKASLKEDVETPIFSYGNLGDIPSKLSEIESAYKTATDALEEYNKTGTYSMSTIDSILSLSNDYINALIDEDGQLQIDENSIARLAGIKIEAAKASVYQEACEELVRIKTLDTALAAQELALANGTLTKSAYDTAKGLYEEVAAMGGANAALANTVWTATGAKIKLLDNQLKSLKSGAYNVKKVLSDSSKSASSDPLKDAFTSEYNTLKHNLDMEAITEKEYYNSLQALNQKYFAGKEEYLDDYRKYEEEIYKGLKKAAKETIDSQMDYLGSKLDAGIISYQYYSSTIKSLIDDMYRQGNLSAEDHFEYTQKMLEKQKGIYDKVLSSVTRRLDKEIQKNEDIIDSIEKQNNALEEQKDKYDKVTSAVKTLIDTKKEEIQSSIDSLEKENEALNKQVSDYDSVLNAVRKVYEEKQNELKAEQDAIQERIDALQEENDEHKRAIELQKAKYELERSMNQRSQFVFDGEQFVYQVDDQAIRENQEKVSDLELEQTISNMEKEKEALQGLIDELDKYKNLWAETANAYQDIIDKELAKNILGENYDQEILLNRIEVIEAFKNRYIAAQEKIDDNTSLIESYNEKLEYYENLKKKWEDLSSAKEESTNRQIASELLGQEWEALILEDRLTSFEEFADTYLSIQNQIDDNTSMIESYNEKIVYYENLKQQWSDISDAYQNSIDDQYAAMILGQNWEAEVLSGRISTLTQFKNDYIQLQEAMAQADVDRYNIQVAAAENAEARIKSANASIHNGENITGNYGDNNHISGGKNDSIDNLNLYKVVDSKTGKVYIDGLESFSAASNWVAEQEEKRKYTSSILTRMQIQKYEHGGIIGKKDSSPLDFIAKSVGEDHMAAVQEGEMILPKNFDLLRLSGENVMKQQLRLDNSFSPVNNDLLMKQVTQPIEVTIGDIILEEVQNVDSLAHAIITQLPNKVTQRLSYSG